LEIEQYFTEYGAVLSLQRNPSCKKSPRACVRIGLYLTWPFELPWYWLRPLCR